MKHFNFRGHFHGVIHTMTHDYIRQTLEERKPELNLEDREAIDEVLGKLDKLEVLETLTLSSGATYTRVQ